MPTIPRKIIIITIIEDTAARHFPSLHHRAEAREQSTHKKASTKWEIKGKKKYCSQLDAVEIFFYFISKKDSESGEYNNRKKNLPANNFCYFYTHSNYIHSVCCYFISSFCARLVFFVVRRINDIIICARGLHTIIIFILDSFFFSL